MRAYISTVLSPYLAYVGFFLGIGLVSGSVVHFPRNPIRYAIIGSVGIFLFVIASLVDEIVIKKRNLKENGILRVILFSVVLSMGIGMISGAIQHFTDTPKYAALLIPTGIVVSLFGFLLKHHIRLTRSIVGWSTLCLLIVCVPLGITLTTWAEDLTTPHAHVSGVAEQTVRSAGSRVEVKGKDSLNTGEVDLTFTLLSKDGQRLSPNELKTMHEKKLHLLLVRDDMTGFQHLHPEYVDGAWTVKTTVPEQGNYQMYVDIAPTEEAPSVLRVPLTIGGATQSPNAPQPQDDLSARDGEYVATLMIDKPLKTQESKRWTFALTRNGQSVTDLAPYLGAYGHVVQLRHGSPEDFFHVHPVTERQPTDGRVTFEGTFPVKGRYTLYAQFNIRGLVKTFPITVDVSEEGEMSSSVDAMPLWSEVDHGGHH